MSGNIKPDEIYWIGYADGAKSGARLANLKRWTLCREELPPYDETVWITAKKENGERYARKAFRDGALRKWIGENEEGEPTLEVTDTIVSWMKYYPEPMEEVVG